MLRLAEEQRIELWATTAMLAELTRVRRDPRLQPRRLKLGLEITDLIAYATALVALVELEQLTPVVFDDPDDDVFVNCAVAVGAKDLISGDKHLLNLKQWQNPLIVTVREFLEREFPL